MEIDRISLNFHGLEELALAKRLRTVAGHAGINRLIKKALVAYFRDQLATPPQEPSPRPALSTFGRIARKK